MAKRRFFSSTIVEDDVFLDMPLSSQALYLHLCMNADDDGFVSPKKVMRMCNASQDDLLLLVSKKYVIIFESGVVVIKHWPVQNTIKKDRYIQTSYKVEFEQLTFNEWGAYTLKRNAQVSILDYTSQNNMPVNSITTDYRGETDQNEPNGRQMVPQVKLSKVSNSNTKVLLVNSDKPVHVRPLLQELIKLLGFSDQVKLTDGRLQKLKSRLKTYTPDEMLLAARNLGEDKYMQGDNEGGKRWGNIDYLLRSDEVVDKWRIVSSNNKLSMEELEKYV